MAMQRRKRFKTAPVGRRAVSTLMQQPGSEQKHPTPMTVAEMMGQGKAKKHNGQGHRSVRDLMAQ